MTKKKTRKELLAVYDFAGRMSGGLVRVRKGRKEFHAFPNGKPAYRQRFDEVGDFSSDGIIARARKGDKTFHIRRNGTIIR